MVIGLLSVAAGAAGIVAASDSAFIVNGIFNMVLAFQLKNLKGQIEKPEREGRVRVKGEGQQYVQ